MSREKEISMLGQGRENQPDFELVIDRPKVRLTPESKPSLG